MNSPLYLASQSLSRQQLLTLAGISFKLASHTSDECISLPEASFTEQVRAIALDKMACVELPVEAQDYDDVFVMTADTLVRTAATKDVLGKPVDKQHAHEMLALLRDQPAQVVTATCIEKRSWQDGAWQSKERKVIVTDSTVEFVIPEDHVDLFLEREQGALSAAGCAVIENFGLSFLKTINGSFTSVLGLPLYEVRTILASMKFFN